MFKRFISWVICLAMVSVLGLPRHASAEVMMAAAMNQAAQVMQKHLTRNSDGTVTVQGTAKELGVDPQAYDMVQKGLAVVNDAIRAGLIGTDDAGNAFAIKGAQVLTDCTSPSQVNCLHSSWTGSWETHIDNAGTNLIIANLNDAATAFTLAGVVAGLVGVAPIVILGIGVAVALYAFGANDLGKCNSAGRGVVISGWMGWVSSCRSL